MITNEELCYGCILCVTSTEGDPFCNLNEQACFDITRIRGDCYLSLESYNDFMKRRSLLKREMESF